MTVPTTTTILSALPACFKLRVILEDINKIKIYPIHITILRVVLQIILKPGVCPSERFLDPPPSYQFCTGPFIFSEFIIIFFLLFRVRVS